MQRMSPTRSDAAPGVERVLGQKLLQAWGHVVHGQHPMGEIVSFRRDADGNHQYVRSPFVSTLVHDALRCFDASAPGYVPGSGDLVPERLRRRFRRDVAQLRRRVRGFLEWQQEAQGWWRFFARGSGIDPDVNTTACAADALRERRAGHSPSAQERQVVAVRRFRTESGCYHTFLKPGRGGYAWLDSGGWPVVGLDRVVNADVLRFLGPTEDPAELRPLIRWLLDQAEEGGWRDGTPLYPNPLSFAYSMSRTWDLAGLTWRPGARDALLQGVLELQDGSGAFGGPLSTALATATLLHAHHHGPELRRACAALTWALGEDPEALHEDFLVDGFGSPALTAAMAMSALAGFHCLDGVAHA
jgi:hypothetical protein